MIDTHPSQTARLVTWLSMMMAIVLVGSACTTPDAPAGDEEPVAETASSAEAENIRLVGHHDLQGREALMAVALSDPDNGSWLYVGHHDSYYDGAQRMNPITNQMEWNGTSILDIADPANPRLVWHIPNDVNANSRAVSVVYDYGFQSEPSGRDYLIRNYEAGDDMKFQIFDITERDTDPSQISLVSEITGTPENSCGPGCGGRFINRVHKGWWSSETGYFYSAAGEPGFQGGAIGQIWDLRDPRNPRFVGRAYLPIQKDGAEGFNGEYAHHPIVDEENQRLYFGFRGGGNTGAWDISDPANPALLWSLRTSPPGRQPHTVSPIVYDEVPNFSGDALPRTYAFVVDEAAGDDMAPCPNGVRSKTYMFDITFEANPFPVSVWEVPVGDFCEKGGRFGPHQSAETINGRINRFEDKMAWVAYFNAGIRVVDLSDPYHPREIGHYIPETNENSHPVREDQPTVVQLNDVDIDHRGLAYATDRVGTGLWVLEYTGPRPGAAAPQPIGE